MEQKEETRTLPSEASNNFTGQSRTDATKQYTLGSEEVADGNQVVSRTGAACENVDVGAEYEAEHDQKNFQLL